MAVHLSKTEAKRLGITPLESRVPRPSCLPHLTGGESGSDSELEATLLGQLRMLNIHDGRQQYRWHPTRRYRSDIAFVDQRLLIEVEGGQWLVGQEGHWSRHMHPQGFEDDCIRSAEAAILGWRMIRCTTTMVLDGRAVTLIERALNGSGDGPQ